jgi:hypothetical protein
MPVIGMTVNKRQKEELKAIVREMCLTQFAHPQDPNILSTFLPPGADVGILVQVAVEQYVTYFRRLKAEAMAAAQAPVKTQLTTAQAVAQAAINRSKALRRPDGRDNNINSLNKSKSSLRQAKNR